MENTSSYTVPMNGGAGDDVDVEKKVEEMERNESQLQSIDELPTFLRSLLQFSPAKRKKTFVFIQFMMGVGFGIPVFSYITSSIIIGSVLAGYLFLVNCSMTQLPDFTCRGVFLDLLLKDAKLTKKINENMKGVCIFNMIFIGLVMTPFGFFCILEFAKKIYFNQYTFIITIIIGGLGSMFMIINIPFDANATLLDQVSLVHIDLIRTYLEQIRDIILNDNVEDGISLAKKLSKEQKKVEKWIIQINGGISTWNSFAISILMCNGIIMLILASGGFSLAGTIAFAILAVWMFMFLYNTLYALAKPNLIWEQQKIRLFNDAEVVLNMKFPKENFETWLSRHDINASRAFGTKVTFEKMKQAAGVLTSVFGIVLYLLLREELRKYL